MNEKTEAQARLIERDMMLKELDKWIAIYHATLDKHNVPSQEQAATTEVDRLGCRAVFLASYYSTAEGMKKEELCES